MSCSSSASISAGGDPIERKVDSLLASMTLTQKIGQTALRGTSSRVKGALPEELKEAVRKGEIGAMLNVMNPAYVDTLQRIAVEESPLGIPLIFARDVIHGFKTIFPIPLGIAASWDTATAYQSSRVAAVEASADGIRWTFAPMLDLSRDARWGRIAESPGEDPYLASQLAGPYVHGFHGTGLDDPTNMLACAKHFVGYGAAIGGRDYNTVVIDEAQLRHMYFPAFQAALAAGAPTVMTAFNDLNGMPVSGNTFLLQQVLRDEWKFDGFVVSDWNSIIEMIAHGVAEDERKAAEMAAKAGLDMEMTSQAYEKNLAQLIEDGVVSESRLDFLVRNILRIKLRMGLFEQPYRREKVEKPAYHPDHLAAAKEAAIKSSVLLTNDGVLPLNTRQRIALIGPLADAPREQLGTWTFDGEGERSITPKQALEAAKANFRFAPGLSFSRDSSIEVKDMANMVAAAIASDVIVLVAGEEAILSGEAHSRADISLPGAQEELIQVLSTLGKPIVLVLMAGRPLAISHLMDKFDAVLMMWHPGTMGGPALQEILYGMREPEGRLPVSWPKMSGQVPLYYNHKNTGRPANIYSYVPIDKIPVGAWQSSLGNESHYLDAGFTPHFPFGHGLSYTTFTFTEASLSSETLPIDGNMTVTTTVTNTGSRTGSTIAQLYVRDLVASLTRPVRELKRFERVALGPGESQVITFNLPVQELGFYLQDGRYVVESGAFMLGVGPDATVSLDHKFEVK